MLQESEAVKALTEVGVDVVGLVDFADVIFEEEEELSFGRFMEIVLELRGSNGATVKDVIELRKLVRNSIADIQFQLTRIEKTVEDCMRHIQHVSAAQSSHKMHHHHADNSPPRNTWCPGEEQHEHSKHCHSEENKNSKHEDVSHTMLPFIQRGFADLSHKLDAMIQEASNHRDPGDKSAAKDERIFEDFTASWQKEESASGRLKLEPIDSLKSTSIDHSGEEERYRAPDSRLASVGTKASLCSVSRETRGDDLNQVRSRVSKLAKHLTAGLVEVKEMQRTLSSLTVRARASQEGEVS